MILTLEELVELTKRRYATAQARELDFLKIPYKRRSDGSLIVLKIHVETGQTHQISDDRRPEPRLRFDS